MHASGLRLPVTYGLAVFRLFHGFIFIISVTLYSENRKKLNTCVMGHCYIENLPKKILADNYCIKVFMFIIFSDKHFNPFRLQHIRQIQNRTSP